MRAPSLRSLLLAATLLSPFLAVAAPYDLDGGWGESGRVAVLGDGPARAAILQSDGGLVLVLERELRRVRADGVMDSVFGSAGRVTTPLPELAITAAAQRPDGRLDVIWLSEPIYLVAGIFRCDHRQWVRYTPSGQPDTAFGGGAGVSLTGGCSGAGMTVDGAGFAYWVARGGVSFSPIYGVAVNRYDSAGNRVADLDGVTQDYTRPPLWEPVRLVVDAGGRLLASARLRDVSTGFALIRYAGDGRDPAFGRDGITFERVPGFVSQAGVLPLSDGAALAFGTAYADGRAQPALVRFTERGDVDTAFGTNGLAIVPLTRPGEMLGTPVVAEAADGRIVVAADVSVAGIVYSRLGRLLANGRPDLRFAGAGVAPATFAAGLHSLFVRPSGAIVLGLATEVVQLRGGELAVPRVVRERRVVEYLQPVFGHYFVTADEPEIALLDTGANGGWQRTGEGFEVFDSAVTPQLPMCRFWSDQSFAPKSSHFYTPYPDECAAVKQNPAWRFERDAFHARLPEGAAGTGACAAGTRPLYRAYNNGAGGAPNHRYTTEPAVLDAMIAQGWTMEGEAQTRVFACVPTR